jgi:hypothetical protein
MLRCHQVAELAVKIEHVTCHPVAGLNRRLTTCHFGTIGEQGAHGFRALQKVRVRETNFSPTSQPERDGNQDGDLSETAELRASAKSASRNSESRCG